MAKIQHKYESVLVVSTTLGEEGINSVVEKFKKLIEDNATMDEIDVWGKRRLAYPINDELEGHYVLYSFTANADFPAELDRIYKITEGVLRSLIIRKED